MTTKKTKTTKKTVTAKKATPTKKAVSSSFRGTARRVTKAIKKVAKANTTRVIDLETLQGLQSAVQVLLKQSEKTKDQVAKLLSEMDDSLEDLDQHLSDLEWSYDIFCSRAGLDRVKDEEPEEEEDEEEESYDDDPDFEDEDEEEDY